MDVNLEKVALVAGQGSGIVVSYCDVVVSGRCSLNLRNTTQAFERKLCSNKFMYRSQSK